MKKMLYVICSLLGLLLGVLNSASAAEAVSEPFRVWPRHEPVCWPTGLEQFVFVELPNSGEKAETILRLTLPENCRVTALPRGNAPSLPAEPDSVFPTAWQQTGCIAEFRLPADAFGNALKKFLTLSVDVQAKTGSFALGFEYLIKGKSLRKGELPVRIYPALSGKQSKLVTVAAYSYPGLRAEYLPVFMEMFRQAGVNAFYQMRGENPELKSTVADFTRKYGMKAGLVFFIHHIREHSPGAKSLAELLDSPEEFKELIRKFFRDKLGNKPYDCVIYDAEAGGLRNGKIQGDTSPHALEVFRKFANIPANTELSVEVIRARYSREWVAYICDQSNRFSRLMREFLDAEYPDFRYEAYSGYELDDGPMKNRTRELYGTDWKTMAATGIDCATAGYHGSMDQIRHTATAVRGKAPYAPAEMYVENFSSSKISGRLPEPWAMRLIRAYMNGDRQGLMLWYANDMDGAALIAVDRLTKFIALVEEFAVKGKLDPEAVTVRPEAEAENVFVLRRGGNALIVALNNSDVEKMLRLNLNGFRVSGFTGELAVNDLADGKTLKAAKVLRITVPAYGYRVLQLMDDGN